MAEKLKILAELVNGRVVGDEDLLITGVAGIEDAKEGEITFLANPKYSSRLAFTQASAIIAAGPVEGKSTIITSNPYLAFAKILSFFNPPKTMEEGIHPTAIISPTAEIGRAVTICSHVYIGNNVRIGDRVVLYPGVFVGDDTDIEEETIIYSNVSIREGCRVGKRVIIHCNTVVGSDGFGFVRDGTKYIKIPQVGRVRIEDDVEIGACVTIDRGTMGDTVIGSGAKIDNLVQVAHNVEIGSDTIIVAQVGISGSTKIGRGVTLAGQVGVVGHLKIGDNCIVGAQSGVAKDLPPNEMFTGSPCIPHRDWLRVQAVIPKLPDLKREIMKLKKELEELKESGGIDSHWSLENPDMNTVDKEVSNKEGKVKKDGKD